MEWDFVQEIIKLKTENVKQGNNIKQNEFLIRELISELSNTKSELSEAKNTINSLKSNITALEGRIDALESRP